MGRISHNIEIGSEAETRYKEVLAIFQAEKRQEKLKVLEAGNKQNYHCVLEAEARNRELNILSMGV